MNVWRSLILVSILASSAHADPVDQREVREIPLVKVPSISHPEEIKVYQSFDLKVYTGAGFEGSGRRVQTLSFETNARFISQAFCEQKGFRTFTNFATLETETYASLVGTEIVRYRYGKFVRIQIPPSADDLFGPLAPGTIATLHRMDREMPAFAGWRQIQPRLTLPSITSILCVKSVTAK